MSKITVKNLLLNNKKTRLVLTPITPTANGSSTLRETLVITGISSAIFLWALAYKLNCFQELAYTSDLFQFSQLATSWLDGRFLHDNCYGNHLSIHTYLLSPALSVFVLPFGPSGLLVALALAMASAFMAFTKILRLYNIPLRESCIASSIIVLMPFSVHVYQDTLYGFHIELLMPAVGLWLAYFLLQRHWAGTFVCALTLLFMKEEAPILAAAIASAIILEDRLRTTSGSVNNTWNNKLALINRPALAVLGAALISLPVFVYILQNQPVTGYSPGSFKRIIFNSNSNVSNFSTLVEYICLNFTDWIRSEQIQQWLGAGLSITFGTILLRFHFFVLGLGITVVAWLMQDDLMWAPRFAPSLAFFQLAAAICLASAYNFISPRISIVPQKKLYFLFGSIFFIATTVIFLQYSKVQRSAEFYRFQSGSEITLSERKQADALYQIYKKERLPGEPTIASTFLFKYVAYKDLFWEVRLDGRPKPTWVLLDQGKGNTAVAKYWDYNLLAQDGRFALFKKP